MKTKVDKLNDDDDDEDGGIYERNARHCKQPKVCGKLTADDAA